MATKPANNPTRRPGLTRATIVDAALEVIDESGIDSLTMRALGERLGVDPMAAYRHFANKAEILDAVADRVVADVAAPDSTVAWDERLVALALDARRALLAHPTMARYLAARPPLGPASLTLVDRLLGVLADGGFDTRTSTRTAQSIIAVVLGTTAAVTDSGSAAEERMNIVRQAFAAAPGELEHLHAAAEVIGDDNGDVGQLRWSLELLVAGLRARSH
ncbi:MAG: TetR/AcrR family transcriptional regulator C-terminal domain-containing protein [Acidimicrobiales bacterium]